MSYETEVQGLPWVPSMEKQKPADESEYINSGLVLGKNSSKIPNNLRGMEQHSFTCRLTHSSQLPTKICIPLLRNYQHYVTTAKEN